MPGGGGYAIEMILRKKLELILWMVLKENWLLLWGSVRWVMDRWSLEVMLKSEIYLLSFFFCSFCSSSTQNSFIKIFQELLKEPIEIFLPFYHFLTQTSRNSSSLSTEIDFIETSPSKHFVYLHTLTPINLPIVSFPYWNIDLTVLIIHRSRKKTRSVCN